MRYVLLVHLLLLSCIAFGGDKSASCALASKSILSHTSDGLAQVSNLGVIEITCRVPPRPFPTKPGESRPGLKAATTAYEISQDGRQELVPAEVNVMGVGGGGFGSHPALEWIHFYVHLPLEPAELDAEARRCFAKIEKASAPEQIPEEARQRALKTLRELNYQHRLGHFQLQCRILDGDRVMGIDVIDFEVLFRGRFSDFGLPAAPPA